MCAVVAFMLWLFFLYHLYLVKAGYSTNENSKSSGVRYFNDRKLKFFTKWLAYKEKYDDFEPSKATLDYYGITKELTEDQMKLEIKRAQKNLD